MVLYFCDYIFFGSCSVLNVSIAVQLKVLQNSDIVMSGITNQPTK